MLVLAPAACCLAGLALSEVTSYLSASLVAARKAGGATAEAEKKVEAVTGEWRRGKGLEQLPGSPAPNAAQVEGCALPFLQGHASLLLCLTWAGALRRQNAICPTSACTALPPAETDAISAAKKDKAGGSSAAKHAAKRAAKKGGAGGGSLGWVSGSWKPVPKDVAIVGLVLVFLGLRCAPRPCTPPLPALWQGTRFAKGGAGYLP